ncbi:homoserine kinase [Parvularcula sp. LCG005]|uniref:homoserine kinase n=1 Tax=Parvularcula sp. LCG005 TaxID=3078805 RepID=UPI0029421489|nr:homoserine kinase [Parvularcula sp. LCG005]WOI53749.1 homoserine kinase [Parvularcula sp. LCG005]
MAVYTRVDESALTEFLARYDLPPATVFKGIAEGVENSNYLVEAGGERFILTLYEKRVNADDLPYFLGLMDHVVEKGVPAASPVHDRTGERLQTLCGRPAALITFLEGTSPDSPSLSQARVAGSALASLHAATADFAGARPNALGPRGWADMVDKSGPRLDEIEAGLHDEMHEAAASLIAEWPTDLPSGTIHADLFPDNVLFRGDEIAGMIDFYFACTDIYAYDLAISMNAWTPEGTTETARAHAFRQGYESVRPLSGKEQAALPLLLRGAALRFLVTRAYDWLHQIPGSLVRVKDPKPYLELLRLHRDNPAAFSKD